MKLVSQHYKSGAIGLQEVAPPALKPRGILVRTHFSVVSSGTEGMKVREGRLSYLGKARARAHILEGLKIALDHLDEVIETIRRAEDVDAARAALMAKFDLSELQAQAILDMRLARLAALERKKIEDEYLEVIQLIAELEDILANPVRVLSIIKDDLTELKRKYAGERRTRVQDDASRELTDEDPIADEDVVVTIS